MHVVVLHQLHVAYFGTIPSAQTLCSCYQSYRTPDTIHTLNTGHIPPVQAEALAAPVHLRRELPELKLRYHSLLS